MIFTESADGLLDLREILHRFRKMSCVKDVSGSAYILEGNCACLKSFVVLFGKCILKFKEIKLRKD